MGLDLTLLPVECNRENFAFSHTMLNTERDYEWYKNIKAFEKVNGSPLTDNFSTFYSRENPDYDDACYHQTTRTPYGDRLLAVPAHILKSTGFDHQSEMNKAVQAYLNCLPDNMMVALYWH